MLYGTRKTKSKWGYVNLISILSCIIIIIFHNHQAEITSALNKSVDVLQKSHFDSLNYTVCKFLGLTSYDGRFDIYADYAYKVQIFIAFAYTYHYVNWFSKTSIINWHVMKKTKAIFIIAAWLIAVLIYYIDYNLGLLTLFCLSMLHVFLEFPLNVKTFFSLFSKNN